MNRAAERRKSDAFVGMDMHPFFHRAETFQPSWVGFAGASHVVPCNFDDSSLKDKNLWLVTVDFLKYLSQSSSNYRLCKFTDL